MNMEGVGSDAANESLCGGCIHRERRLSAEIVQGSGFMPMVEISLTSPQQVGFGVTWR